MKALQWIARQPQVYRWTLHNGSLVERLERLLRRVSGGRIGTLDLAGLPTIQVTVPGRRTGVPRTRTLQAISDGDDLLVVGSNWARPEHPAWSANLLAVDQVAVSQRGEQFTAAVRLLTGPEREHAWRQILVQWPNYRLAQEQIPGREFRLFALRRTP